MVAAVVACIDASSMHCKFTIHFVYLRSLNPEGSDFVIWSCGTLLSAANNKAVQLHTAKPILNLINCRELTTPIKHDISGSFLRLKLVDPELRLNTLAYAVL